MKIAITTPTGHVGSAVADFLLEFGDDFSVTLLGRRPERLRKLTERRAQVLIGSQDDADFLIKATQDVDALFWATPPGYGSDDVRAFQNRLGKAAATAVHTNHVPRVVNLSSIGANLSSGAGPINGLHDVEQRLNDATANVTHLRPGFFFENLLWQADSIKNLGRISLPLSGSKRFPMIATRDIGRAAVQRLIDQQWTGHRVRELHGPADLSFDEVTE
ncbi:MAG: NAD(P)H-binding protein, partial [Thermoguttaceae bacterium]